MKPLLSIIIPCFNCAETLEEAVASCYAQGLEEAGQTFELVLVDDGSTDATRELMTKLASEHRDGNYGAIRTFFHEKNEGGGATRNTAVSHAQADIIFCLDSDDMLGPGTLSIMLACMAEKRKLGLPCDAVGIHYSKKFNGKNADNIDHITTFSNPGKIIPVSGLLQNNGAYCSLYSTFMHTKDAFSTAGGYPTEHGFDTQGFAWRFLMNGLTAYTCPDAVYLHRINFNKSYYVREYESGKANYNWFLILSEFLYVFDDAIKEIILGFDIHGENNLYEEVRKQSNIFCVNYMDYVRKGTKKYKTTKIRSLPKDKITKYDAYWLATESAKEKKHSQALDYFTLAYKKGLRVPAQFSETISFITDENRSEKSPEEIVSAIITQKKFKKRGGAATFLTRAVRKSIRVLKQNRPAYTIGVHLLWICQGIRNYVTERPRMKKYRASIERIKMDKRIVVDLKHGGLGDCLAWSTLPRLLKEVYGIDFYLSEQSLGIMRQKDIFKICFECNPYFKGIADKGPFFSFDTFESEKNIYTFLTSRGGTTILETLERQFNVAGTGKPELYYRPQTLDRYKNTILIDKNMISGIKFGWIFSKDIFEKEAARHKNQNDRIEYVDTSKQDLFGYIDMIYSCKYFVCTFSGGASVAACFDKPFSVIWPLNGKNRSNYQFRYKKSRGKYVS